MLEGGGKDATMYQRRNALTQRDLRSRAASDHMWQVSMFRQLVAVRDRKVIVLLSSLFDYKKVAGYEAGVSAC